MRNIIKNRYKSQIMIDIPSGLNHDLSNNTRHASPLGCAPRRVFLCLELINIIVYNFSSFPRHQFYTPCLGWKEFVPTYFGPLRKGTRREASVDGIVIPSFMKSMWEHRRLKPDYGWRVFLSILLKATHDKSERIKHLDNFFDEFRDTVHK